MLRLPEQEVGGWIMFGECGELLCGKRPSQRLKWLFTNYVKSAFLHGSEVLCLRDGKIHGESNVWSTAQTEKKIQGHDGDVGFESDYISVVHSEPCALV